MTRSWSAPQVLPLSAVAQAAGGFGTWPDGTGQEAYYYLSTPPTNGTPG